MFLGIDLGYGNMKVYGEKGGVIMPAHVATVPGQVVSDVAGMATGKRPLQIGITGREYFVGDNAHAWGPAVENLDYDRLNGSDEAAALLYGALALYFADHEPDEPITMFVGLPLETLSGDQAQATKTAVEKWLLGVHCWSVRGHGTKAGIGYSINVTGVHVTSQPAGAYFDYMLQNDGGFDPVHASHIKEEVGVVSVGYNTIERMVVKSGQPVPKFTAGSTNGVRRLLADLNAAAGDAYTLGELDARLRANELNDVDLRQAKAVWGRTVSGDIEKTWGQAHKRFTRVILVGGGAVVLNGHLAPKFAGRAVVPDKPVLSIARGLYKLALMSQKRGS